MLNDDINIKDTGVLNGGMSKFFMTDNRGIAPWSERTIASSVGSSDSMSVVSNDIFGKFLEKVTN